MNISTAQIAKFSLIVFFIPMSLFGASEIVDVPVTPIIENSTVKKAADSAKRLVEIKATDTSNLSSPEKKKLRIEKKALKKQAKEYGGVYISVGAIIIILLLLILLL